MQRFSIGRTTSCDIYINDQSVSKMHAEIIVNNGEITVRDLGSTNGTFINGMKLYGSQVLRPNDMLKVGNALVPWKNYVDATDNSRTQLNNPVFTPHIQNQLSHNSWDVKEWMLNLFLVSIPIVGLVILIIWANQDDPLKKNFAQASLWLKLIYYGVFIIFYYFIFLSYVGSLASFLHKF